MFDSNLSLPAKILAVVLAAPTAYLLTMVLKVVYYPAFSVMTPTITTFALVVAAGVAVAAITLHHYHNKLW